MNVIVWHVTDWTIEQELDWWGDLIEEAIPTNIYDAMVENNKSIREVIKKTFV